MAGLRLANNSILICPGRFVKENTAKSFKRFGIGTVLAGDDTVPRQDIFMLCTELFLLNKAIQLFAILSTLHTADNDLPLIRLCIEIDRVIIIDHSGEIKIRVIGHTVRLFACGTTDKVHNTVLIIDLSAGHRQCASVRMIMPGEHEIDTRRFGRRGNHVVNLFVAAGGVGVISRLMHGKDLPSCIALSSIDLQPFQRSSQFLPVGCVVNHRHIYIVILYGVMSAVTRGRQIVYLCRSVSRSITRELMISKDMNHIGAAQGISANQLHNIHPVFIAGRVIHGIAGLNTKIVILCIDLLNNTGNLCQILCLNITQNEELHLSVTVIRLESILLRPLFAITDAIHIGRVGSKTRNDRAMDAYHGISALGKGEARTICIHNFPLVCARHLVLQLLCLGIGIGKPRHIGLQAAIL